MSSVGFSALEKNDVLIGQCCPSNSADSNGHLVHVFFSLKLLVQVWQPPTDYNVCRTSNLKKAFQTAITVCSGLSRLPRISAE